MHIDVERQRVEATRGRALNSQAAPSVGGISARHVDVLELRSLADSYAQCMDAGDRERFADLWTTDGILEVFENGPSQPSTGKLRPQHFDFAFDRLAAFQRTMHHVTTHHADINGDEAQGATYCCAHHIDCPGGTVAHDLVMHIRYQDRYRREDGKWRFAHRRVEVLLRETRTVEELS